jgi:hypothetical protein
MGAVEQCRMACRPNDEQIHVEIGGKLDNVAHRDDNFARGQSAAFPSSPSGCRPAGR